jgi:hypothetical protein
LAEHLCADAGGSFLGPETVCDPNPCPGPRGACCFADESCRLLTEEDCAEAGGTYLGDSVSCSPNPCCVLPGSKGGPVYADLGGGGVGRVDPRTEGGCGTLVMNADGTYENGYAWRYGGVVPPDYGAFAECYFGDAIVCAAIFDLSTTGTQTCQTMDIHVYRDAGGVPGPVVSFARVEPGPVAFWPSVSRHSFSVQFDCIEGAWWIGYWGNWPDAIQGWFIGADVDGFGGCPYTNIAPGIGFPTGWNNVSVVWGQTQALGIGAEVIVCGGTPTIDSTWGKIKRTFLRK